jgi:hypothetical protein
MTILATIPPPAALPSNKKALDQGFSDGRYCSNQWPPACRAGAKGAICRLFLRCGEVSGEVLHRRERVRAVFGGGLNTRTAELPGRCPQPVGALRYEDANVTRRRDRGAARPPNVSRRGFEAARDEAGLPSSLTFHHLRHATASRLIGAGLDPVTVAGVLGHEDPNVTLRVYAHLWDRRRTDEAVRAALSVVLSGSGLHRHARPNLAPWLTYP